MIAVFFERIGPYHDARLRAAQRLTNVAAVEFSSHDTTYAWAAVADSGNYKRCQLFDDTGDARPDVKAVRARLESVLDQLSPSVVAIPGWSEGWAAQLLDLCRRRGIPTILMSESNRFDATRRWWSEWVKSRVVRQHGAALVGGLPQSEYVCQLGLSGDRVFTGYNAVDNAYFAAGAAAARVDEQRLRQELDLPPRYFLTVARFIEKKNLSRLVQAYRQYRDLQMDTGADCWSLIILGDGEGAGALRAQVTELSLEDSVLLPGFKQYDQLPVYFGLAGCFVLASTVEQWGLVVNEAMASGLPVLVSDRAGCARDLVHGGQNGFTFSPTDCAELAKLMRTVTTDVLLHQRLSEASRVMIEGYSVDQFAAGLVAAAACAQAQRAVPCGFVDRLLLQWLSRR